MQVREETNIDIVSSSDAKEIEKLDISVVIPVLNEEQSIEELTTRIVDVLESLGMRFEIIYVDDGSDDNTAEEIKKIKTREKRVKLVRFRRNFGKAAALSAGFAQAKGDLILTMDGDLQDIPEEIPKLIEKLEEEDLDLVSTWKYPRVDPWGKKIASKLFNYVTGKIARIGLHDFNSGFKLYRKEVVREINIYGELHRYIPVLASRRGFKVGEVKVKHAPRKYGKSKYGWDRFYKGFLDLLTVLFITKYTRRPLHLFGLVGLIFFTAGFLINAYLAYLWFNNHSLSDRPLLLLGILLMLIGIQVLTTGLLGEMITYKNFKRQDSYSVKEIIE